MVQGSAKTYGELMLEARSQTDRQEVGETLPHVLQHIKDKIIDYAVQANYEKGIKGKYYIHVRVQLEPYSTHALHLYPQCRRTRPSPYQVDDHYLWSVEDGGKVTFEWCIPKKEVVHYILKHPGEFDVEYVRMIRKYTSDRLEKIEDYMIGDKVI